MITFPNAKINLGLDIVSRREDGYHDLVSVFYPLPWRDILEIVPAQGEETTLTVTGRGCDCSPADNLVMRAYRAISSECGGIPPVNIFLRKIIPDGAGLGGGSADAAFTLKMLNEMFALGKSDGDLARIATTLGADCTFFIYNRPMIATGTGTTLSPATVSLKGLTIAVVKPPVHVSTREAYSGVKPQCPQLDLAETLASLPPFQWHGKVKNDFEPSIFTMHPEIARVKETMQEYGALYASMSGSGSAVYGLFDSVTLAEQAAGCFGSFDHLVAPMD